MCEGLLQLLRGVGGMLAVLQRIQAEPEDREAQHGDLDGGRGFSVLLHSAFGNHRVKICGEIAHESFKPKGEGEGSCCVREFCRESRDNIKKSRQRFGKGELRGQALYGVMTKRFKHGVNILEVVVKGVAVDAAIVHDIPYRDLIDRLFFGEAEEGLQDRFFGED